MWRCPSYRLCFFFIAGFVLFAGNAMAARAADPLRIVSVQPVSAGQDKAPVKSFTACEYALTLSGGAAPYDNPYDPGEIAVDAIATGPPRTTTLRVPAFWYEPYERATVSANRVGMVKVAGQTAGWRVRIAFPTAGIWQVTVAARDRSGSATSESITVKVAPGAARGFVRRADNNRYLRFDSGASYFPVGENVCWSDHGGLTDFDDWFRDLGKAGGNYARVWLAHEPIENTTLGRYDQKNAAYYDEVVRAAARNGIYCLLSLGTYGELRVGGFFNEGTWAKNVYNAANGGPAAKPDDIFTDPRAIAFYQRRLRYLIARYSAFTGVAFWELWNEQGGPTPWFKTMAVYLKAHDPYQHLVTTSYSTTGPAEVWEIPEIDMTQTHRYGDGDSLPDIAPAIATDAREHDRFGKPHLMGEFGISWRGGDDQYDKTGIGTNLHNGLWAGMMSGDAGGAAIWWWDGYVAPKNLYHTFTGPARFAAAVDWSRRRFQPLEVASPSIGAVNAPETFHDLTLRPSSGWGAKPNGPTLIGRDGRTTGGALPQFLYGPAKAELSAAFTLKVDLKRASTLTLHIATVSDAATLRVSIDGRATDFPFVAAPGHGQDFESTKQFPEYGGIYQALFNKDRSVPIAAGSHTITLSNTAGDWLTIGAITLRNALSSRYSVLVPLALQDRETGETLVWLHDPASNWINIDRAGKLAATYPAGSVRLRLPQPHAGRFDARWWNTKTGAIVASQTVSVPGNSEVTLPVPAFAGDIALQLK
jgi:hypothetical protein